MAEMLSSILEIHQDRFITHESFIGPSTGTIIPFFSLEAKPKQ
jgi:hypothetical protein